MVVQSGNDAPPHSLEAERAWLSALLFRVDLLDDPAVALPASAIYSDRHRLILGAITALRVTGQGVDSVMVAEWLESRGQFDDAGGLEYLTEVMQAAPHTEHAASYAATIRDKALRRAALKAAEQIVETARDPDADLRIDFPGIAESFLERCEAAGGTSPVKLLSSREFDEADYTVRFLVDGMLVAAQPMIGGGPAKGCKTIVTAAAIVHGATGTPVFGHEKFSVPKPFRSAFVSMESGGASIRTHARSVCESLGITLSDLDGMVHWQMDSLKLSDPATLTALRREIERRQIEFFCVDPLYLSLDLDDGDSANVFKMGKRLGEVGKVCADTGCSIALVHHGIKRPLDPYRPMKLVDLSGAGVTEFARQWLLLSRRTEYDEDQPGHHELWFRCGGSAFAGSLYGLDIEEFDEWRMERKWSVTVRSASDVSDEADRTKAERDIAKRDAKREATESKWIDHYAPRVVDYLRDHPDGLCEDPTRKALGMDPSAWRHVYAHLLQSGEIEQCDVQRGNGRSYPGFNFPDRIHHHSSPVNGEMVVNGDELAQHAGPPPFGPPIKGANGHGGDALRPESVKPKRKRRSTRSKAKAKAR